MGNTTMIIFLYGGDDFGSRRKLNEIIEQYRMKNPGSFNFYQIDFESKNAFGELQNGALSVSMFPEKKFFVLKNVFSLPKGKNPQEEEIVSFLKRNNFSDDSNAILTFWQEGEPSAANLLLKELIKKPNLVQKFDLPEGRSLEDWIEKEARSRGAKIAPPAIRFLALAVGSDLWRMEQEIAKLANYKKDGVIELKDAQALVKAKIDSNVFELVDAIAVRDKRAAFALVKRELEAGSGEIYLMTMIAYQFRNLIKVASCGLKDGLRIPKELKMHPYVVKKTLAQLKNFSGPDLRRIYQKLFSFDLAVKTGRLQPELALEMLILEI